MEWIVYITSGQFKADIKELLKGQLKMANTIADVDAALTANDATLASLAEALTTLNSTAVTTEADVKALAAKVAAAAPDLSPEVAHIQQQATALANLTAAINTALASVQATDTEATQ